MAARLRAMSGTQPKDLPVSNSQLQPSPKRSERRIQDHHTQEWSSGGRGGGSVPADFGWSTNPKQYQEEYGSSTLDEEKDLSKERYSKR